MKKMKMTNAMGSQKPPAKPEACRRCSGSKPHGPSGGDSSPDILPTPWALVRPLPCPVPTRVSTRHLKAISVSAPSRKRPLLMRVFHDPQLLPSRSRDIPGTVKLWESLRQSRRVSRSSNSLRLTHKLIPKRRVSIAERCAVPRFSANP